MCNPHLFNFFTMIFSTYNTLFENWAYLSYSSASHEVDFFFCSPSFCCQFWLSRYKLIFEIHILCYLAIYEITYHTFSSHLNCLAMLLFVLSFPFFSTLSTSFETLCFFCSFCRFFCSFYFLRFLFCVIPFARSCWLILPLYFGSNMIGISCM